MTCFPYVYKCLVYENLHMFHPYINPEIKYILYTASNHTLRFQDVAFASLSVVASKIML